MSKSNLSKAFSDFIFRSRDFKTQGCVLRIMAASLKNGHPWSHPKGCLSSPGQDGPTCNIQSLAMLCLEAKTTGTCFRRTGKDSSHPYFSGSHDRGAVVVFPSTPLQSLQPSPISQNHNSSSNQHLPTANYMPGTWLSPFYVCI